jgi:hypothetical protein
LRVSRDNGKAVVRGWPRGPWFETALKKRLLAMRFPLLRDSPYTAIAGTSATAFAIFPGVVNQTSLP